MGGQFAANTQGLEHYRAQGYKRLLTTPKAQEEDAKSSAWIRVPYRFNRGIVHDGDFPHLSTRIEELPSHLRRVILGFNLFTHDVGPDAQRAPEHSGKVSSWDSLGGAVCV